MHSKMFGRVARAPVRAMRGASASPVAAAVKAKNSRRFMVDLVDLRPLHSSAAGDSGWPRRVVAHRLLVASFWGKRRCGK
jgi:hypothetical protein